MVLARAHIFVSGIVQGVGFRYFTARHARALGLKGWVRNTRDGRVEIVVEGEKNRIERLIELVKRGPALARVDDVRVEWEEYKGEFEDFRIRY